MLEKRSTKQILADSALELLSQKTLQKISVQEITSNCNVSLRSFYNHFKDKQDLISWIYLKKEKELFENINDGSSLYDSLLALFTYVYENQKFFANATDYNGQNNLTESVFLQAKNTIILAIEKAEGEEALDTATLFAIEFWIHGVNAMSKAWFSAKKPPTPAELMDLIIGATPSRLLPYIQKTSTNI